MPRRGVLIHDAQPLAPLVEKSDLLKFTGTLIAVKDKLPTAVDQYGIPDRVAMMREVLGTIAGKHIWTGDYDLHHVSWPRKNYVPFVEEDGTKVGIGFRNAPALRLVMPRQMHEYVHTVTEPPMVPTLDVMRQFHLEHGQVGRLYDTIKSAKTHEDIARYGFPRASSVDARRTAFRQKIEAMQDGQIGVMPKREHLYDMEIDEARRVLRSIARANGLSNSRKSYRSFFSQTVRTAA